MNESKIDNYEVKNFQFVFSINQKIILEYLLNLKLTSKELNYIDVCFISFLVKISQSNLCNSMILENEKYYFVMNNFILKNLIFINIGSKQIGNIISKLEKLGIIKRHIENNNSRYLKVNDFILTNWNVNDNKGLTATERLKKYKNDLWKQIENEFGFENDFQLWIVNFDYTNIKNQNESLSKISSGLWRYLTECKKQSLKKRIN